MNITFEQAVTEKQIKVLADTANVVWHEAYKGIVSIITPSQSKITA